MEECVEQTNVRFGSVLTRMAHVSTAHLIPENQTTASFAGQTSAAPLKSYGKMVHVSIVENILGLKEMAVHVHPMFAQRGRS